MPLPSPSDLQSDLTQEAELTVYINSYQKLQADVTFGVLERKWDMIKRRYLFTKGVLPPTHMMQIEGSDYLFNKGLKNNFANLRKKLMGW